MFVRQYIRNHRDSSMMQVAWSRQIALGLYRRLLREAATLRYTDKDFYRKKIQEEFRRHMHETDESRKLRQVQKGYHLLETKLGGLV